MEQLYPKAVWLFFIRFITIGIIPFFVFVFFAAQVIVGRVVSKLIGEIGNGGGEPVSTSWMFGMGIISLLIFLLYLVFCYFWARLTYRYWRYQLTEDTIKIERGVIWKKYITIPYAKIQNVDVYRGVVDRILGLSELHIQTAGYSGYGRHTQAIEGQLPGLAPQTAEELRKFLIQSTKETNRLRI